MKTNQEKIDELEERISYNQMMIDKLTEEMATCYSELEELLQPVVVGEVIPLSKAM